MRQLVPTDTIPRRECGIYLHCGPKPHSTMLGMLLPNHDAPILGDSALPLSILKSLLHFVMAAILFVSGDCQITRRLPQR